MIDRTTAAPSATFKRPDGLLIAAMGCLIAGAAFVGAVLVIVLMREFDTKTLVLLALGVIGAVALGAGFLNTWREPMLTIWPDRLRVPTFLGAREIILTPGHPVGELLATPAQGSRQSGDFEANKFVHFFTLDGAGKLVELVALHRASPLVGQIRRAFEDVAGLKVEVMARDTKAPRPRPEVAHWHPR